MGHMCRRSQPHKEKAESHVGPRAASPGPRAGLKRERFSGSGPFIHGSTHGGGGRAAVWLRFSHSLTGDRRPPLSPWSAADGELFTAASLLSVMCLATGLGSLVGGNDGREV